MKISCRIVINHNGKVLAIATDEGYTLPGGRFKRQEDGSFAICAARELYEETSVFVNANTLDMLFHGIADSGTYTYTFTGVAQRFPKSFQATHEGQGTWVSWKELTGPEAKHPAYNQLVLEELTRAR